MPRKSFTRLQYSVRMTRSEQPTSRHALVRHPVAEAVADAATRPCAPSVSRRSTRTPFTTSKRSVSARRRGMSAGSFWRSPSSVAVHSPRAARKPASSAALWPEFGSRRTRRMRGSRLRERAAAARASRRRCRRRRTRTRRRPGAPRAPRRARGAAAPRCRLRCRTARRPRGEACPPSGLPAEQEPAPDLAAVPDRRADRHVLGDAAQPVDHEAVDEARERRARCSRRAASPAAPRAGSCV